MPVKNPLFLQLAKKEIKTKKEARLKKSKHYKVIFPIVFNIKIK